MSLVEFLCSIHKALNSCPSTVWTGCSGIKKPVTWEVEAREREVQNHPHLRLQKFMLLNLRKRNQSEEKQRTYTLLPYQLSEPGSSQKCHCVSLIYLCMDSGFDWPLVILLMVKMLCSPHRVYLYAGLSKN